MPLNRREILKQAGAFGIAAAVTGKLPGVLRASDEGVPPILEGAVTTDNKEANKKRKFILTNHAVNDRDGRTTAVYSLQSDNQIERLDFNPKTGKYELRSNTAPVPMRKALAITGFADSGENGNEKIIVGGYQGDNSYNSQSVAIAVSSDSGQTFKSLVPKGILGGQVKEIKKIPTLESDMAIARVSNQQDVESQYIIYDAKDDRLQLVASATDDLPLIDNVFSAKNSSEASIAGRVIRRDQQGMPMVMGIANLKLDLKNGIVTNGNYNLDRYLVYLDDLFELRDDAGEVYEYFALQSINDPNYGLLRLIHRIKLEELEKGTYNIEDGFEYGQGYDQMVLNSFFEIPGLRRDLTDYRITTHVRNIDVYPGGHTWLTGGIDTVSGELPIGVYQMTNEEGPIADEDSIRPALFLDMTTIPSGIKDQPEEVMFKGKNNPNPKESEAVYGMLFNLQAGATAIIETDANRVPFNGPEWYQMPGPQYVPLSERLNPF